MSYRPSHPRRVFRLAIVRDGWAGPASIGREYQGVFVRLETTGHAMAVTSDGAHLAHLSDTVRAVAEQLDEQREVQQNILTVLSHLLETSRAQSEMLADVLDVATQDVGPSA